MTLRLFCEICEHCFTGNDYSEICPGCDNEVSTIVDEFELTFSDMWEEVNDVI